MKITMQAGPDRHSRVILDALYQYDDFMGSVATVVDLGCGTGQDLEWWATATTRDDDATPLNIRCVGVDLQETLPVAKKYSNITYQRANFETAVQPGKEGYDVLWCNDAFHYAVDPIGTLTHWRSISTDGAMLMISIPQTLNIKQNKFTHYLSSGCYYHHSLISLIYMLALTGWDCRAGFFLQKTAVPWITAVVYKSEQQPRDARATTWYDLAESGLLPESAVKSIKAHGHLQQDDLILPWLDKSFIWMGKP